MVKHDLKVGDKVRRTDYDATGDVRAGAIGVVYDVDSPTRFSIKWKEGCDNPTAYPYKEGFYERRIIRMPKVFDSEGNIW